MLAMIVGNESVGRNGNPTCSSYGISLSELVEAQVALRGGSKSFSVEAAECH